MAGKNAGFTLIELLVVIAIVGVLLSLALPAVQSVRATAKRASCANNVRQIALAAHAYESAFNTLPAGSQSLTSGAYPAVSWLAKLLPYLEEATLWEVSLDEHHLGLLPSSHTAFHLPVKCFGCPMDGRSGASQSTHGGMIVGLTSYVGVSGVDRSQLNGVLLPNRSIRFGEITDGLSHTLLIGERPPSPDNWYGFWYWGLGQDSTGIPDMIMGVNETNLQVQYAESCPIGPYRYMPGKFGEMCDTFHFWSPHSGGANFAFADASIKFLPYDAEPFMDYLATRNGHESIEQSW